MKKPNITEGEWYVNTTAFSDTPIVTTKENGWVADVPQSDGMELANAKAISASPKMIDALIKMQKLWWNEVYEFGYGKFEGDVEKATELADKDAHNKLMVEALKKAGCTE